MANSTRDGRRRRQSSSRQVRSSRQQRSSRPRNRSTRAPQSGSRRGTLTRPDTGYSLHSRRVRRDVGISSFFETILRPRVLLFLVILVIVAVVMVVGVSSCIRRKHETDNQKIEETKPKNEQDARVAAGVSASMTSKFTSALNDCEYLATIAQNADQYEDDRLLELALAEPSSRAFIAAYPKSDKSSRPYVDEVRVGEVPNLYNWDEHWGAVTYGNGPLAVTGSGPTTLAMAYMGLTGKTDYSPTEIAQQASKSNYADEDSGSKGELFSKLGTTIGLTVNEYEPLSDTLLTSLGTSTVIAAELKSGTLTDDAHWVLVVNVNSDSTVTVFDPTSTVVSSRSWSAETVANSSTKFFALSPSEASTSSKDKTTDSSSTSSSSSNKNSSTASSSSTS